MKLHNTALWVDPRVKRCAQRLNPCLSSPCFVYAIVALAVAFCEDSATTCAHNLLLFGLGLMAFGSHSPAKRSLLTLPGVYS